MEMLFNLLLVLFNGLLALFTYLLWKESRRQAQILEQSVFVAKEFADAAKLSAQLAKESLTVLERPYVLVEDIKPLI